MSCSFDPRIQGWGEEQGMDDFATLFGPLWSRLEAGEKRYAFLADQKHLNHCGGVHGGMSLWLADKVPRMKAWEAWEACGACEHPASPRHRASGNIDRLSADMTIDEQSQIKKQGALTGVRVGDVTTTVRGPVATPILGDLGADVVKIKPPLGGAGYPRLMTPERRPFRTKGGFICVSATTDQQWVRLVGVVGRLDLAADRRFSKMAQRTFHFEAAFPYLNEALLGRTTADWTAVLRMSIFLTARICVRRASPMSTILRRRGHWSRSVPRSAFPVRRPACVVRRPGWEHTRAKS